MSSLVPEWVRNSKVYPPGKPIEEIKRKYGIEDIVKLNSNENCMGPSPKAVRAVAESLNDIHHYPDNSAFILKNKLAAKHGIDPDQIILGNGSNEIVQFIIMTFLLPGQEIITAKPTFLLYRIMGGVFGGRVKEIELKDYSFDLEAMAKEVTDETKLVFISNPNNPTGTVVEKEMLDRFMDSVPSSVVVVMDEAYFDYITMYGYPDAVNYVKQGKNVIVLRTFSKAYGLAGLRIGYAVAPLELTRYMDRLREPFNANLLAQKGSCAALDDTEYLKKTIENNIIGRDYLYGELKQMGLDFVPTQTNFILVKTGPDTARLCTELLKQGVMVRSMAGFGIEEFIRVTIGLPDENRRFVDSLSGLLGNRE